VTVRVRNKKFELEIHAHREETQTAEERCGYPLASFLRVTPLLDH
jgi:hypothetical protein